MLGVESICSYYVKLPLFVDNEFVSVIEWDLVNPEESLNDIITGRAFNYCAKVYNFNSSNSNKMLIKTSYRNVNKKIKKLKY